MRRKPVRTPLKSGFDRVGPFHPYVAFAAVVLVDLLGLALIVVALLSLGDHIEDRLSPGGPEWIDL